MRISAEHADKVTPVLVVYWVCITGHVIMSHAYGHTGIGCEGLENVACGQLRRKYNKPLQRRNQPSAGRTYTHMREYMNRFKAYIEKV